MAGVVKWKREAERQVGEFQCPKLLLLLRQETGTGDQEVGRSGVWIVHGQDTIRIDISSCSLTIVILLRTWQFDQVKHFLSIQTLPLKNYKQM
jgi:hypothetical protein